MLSISWNINTGMFGCFWANELTWISVVKVTPALTVTRRPADTWEVPLLRFWGWISERLPLEQLKRGKYKISFAIKLYHDLNLSCFKVLYWTNWRESSSLIIRLPHYKSEQHLPEVEIGVASVLLERLQSKQYFSVRRETETIHSFTIYN